MVVGYYTVNAGDILVSTPTILGMGCQGIFKRLWDEKLIGILLRVDMSQTSQYHNLYCHRSLWS